MVPALQEPNSDNSPHTEGTSQLYLRRDVSQASETDSLDSEAGCVICYSISRESHALKTLDGDDTLSWKQFVSDKRMC